MPAPVTSELQGERLCQGELRVSIIGAGSFARAVMIPALRKTRGVTLHSVATASGVASESARHLFGFARAVQPRSCCRRKTRTLFSSFPATTVTPNT